jgi:hypothetical protein
MWCSGLGTNVYPPDGSLARGAYCNAGDPWGSVAVGNDGTVYYDDAWTIQGTNYNFIRKVAPDGRVYTLMGQAGPLLSGEDWHDQMNQPALTARLNPVPVPGLAVGRDGSVFVSVQTGYPFAGGIFKITPGGTVEPVLSAIPLTSVGREYDTSPVWSGDEGKVAANMTNTFFLPAQTATSLVVAPDSSLLFGVTIGGGGGDTELWRITPNGILQRLAGRALRPLLTHPSLSWMAAIRLRPGFLGFSNSPLARTIASRSLTVRPTLPRRVSSTSAPPCPGSLRRSSRSHRTTPVRSMFLMRTAITCARSTA